LATPWSGLSSAWLQALFTYLLPSPPVGQPQRRNVALLVRAAHLVPQLHGRRRNIHDVEFRAHASTTRR
jgi:hypothetical protein